MRSIGFHSNNKKAVLDGFFVIPYIPETPGTRTPDNLIKSQVLYHLS